MPNALMLVSVLGLVPNMDKIVELCKRHNVTLLEDTCESMGCEYKGQKLGTFGKMSTFSTFFGSSHPDELFTFTPPEKISSTMHTNYKFIEKKTLSETLELYCFQSRSIYALLNDIL